MAALTSINDVDERHINRAARNWWVYKIAFEWQISPKEVKQWPTDDVLEALAAIGLADRNTPRPNE